MRSNNGVKCISAIFMLIFAVMLGSCSNCGFINHSNDVVDYLLDKKENGTFILADPGEVTGVRFYSSWDYEKDVPQQYMYFTTLSTTDIIESDWLEAYYVQEPYEWLNITGYEQIDFAKLAECFPNLTALGIEGMEFSSLNGIENFVQLHIVSIDMPSNIHDISSLTEVNCLEYLSLYGGRLKDISCINNMPQLLSLEIYSSGVVKLGNLENLPNLAYINLEDNILSNVSSIGNCYALKKINLSRNFLTDISFVTNLTELQELNISDNKISDISCLSTLNSLIYVNCSGNPIESFEPIADIPYSY